MDTAVIKIFEETINKDLINIIISNSTEKQKISKIKIRPVCIKSDLLYQVSEYIGDKIFHQNCQREELLGLLPNWFEGLLKQAEFTTKSGKATLLISKKGKATVIRKFSKSLAGMDVSEYDTDTSEDKSEEKSEEKSEDKPYDKQNGLETLMHNKKKNYILQEGIVLPFLVDLGVMTKDGQVVKAKSDKFRQINRFLEYIEDVLPYLEREKELTILDFGCGKSYLTFAMYYYLKILKGYSINIIGLDLKTDVINHCNTLSKKYGYDKLRFLEGDIASYTGSSSVDMVVTLHACDTATDHALFKATTWNAKVILSVPCCQHELSRQIQSDILKPVLKYGIIKERVAALFTDALRAQLLETQGYKVQLLEFIDMEHTPKNILIRAVKRSTSHKETQEKEEEMMRCMEFLNVSPCLLRLLEEETIEEGK